MKYTLKIELIEGKEYFCLKKDGKIISGTYVFSNILQDLIAAHQEMSLMSIANKDKTEKEKIIEKISNMYFPEENQLNCQKVIIQKLREDNL